VNVKPQDLIDLTRSVNNKQKETKLTSQTHTHTRLYTIQAKIGSYSSHNLIDINTTNVILYPKNLQTFGNF